MSLRKSLIRLAHLQPEMRPLLLPILKEAGKDTVEFVTWALKTQRPIDTSRVISFLERQGVEKTERGPSKAGLPLGVGELVEIQVNNAPGDLQDLLKPFHLQKGNVTEIDGQDIVIKFESGKILRVPGGITSGKTSGVYRTSLLDSAKGMKHIEIVYLAANERPPTQVQVEVVEQYVEKGMAQGEERSEIYYTGYVSSYMISKENKPYFMLWSQQRGGRPRTLSPDKGKVLYVGLVGKRPSGWEAELKDMQSEATEKISSTQRQANVVQTIAEQLGGVRRIRVMLGATLVAEVRSNTLGIQFPNKQRTKGNYVEIEYKQGHDTYEMRFYNRTARDMKLIKKINDIYADGLVSSFEAQTGWYLRMG